MELWLLQWVCIDLMAHKKRRTYVCNNNLIGLNHVYICVSYNDVYVYVLVCIWLLCIYTAIVTLSFIHYTTFMCHVCCWLLLLCILFAVVFVVIENQAMLVASSIYHEKQCSFFSSIALCIQSCLRSLWKLHYCDCEFMSMKRTFSVHWNHSTILSSMILVTFQYIDAIDSTYSGLHCMHLFKAPNFVELHWNVINQMQNDIERNVF